MLRPYGVPDDESGFTKSDFVLVPVAEEVRESNLEIKEAATQLVVTAIEILSPTNVEIDLLPEELPLPLAGHREHSHYRILISRSVTRPLAELYPFNLPDPIPAVPIPLRIPDAEPVVNLQALLMDVYDRPEYNYFIATRPIRHRQ